jgi:hypothetical protein
MRVDVKLPIAVRCNNFGAIFMAKNSSSGIRTCHIDTRYHFVREDVKDGLIDADMFTKNVGKRKQMKNVSTSCWV